MTNLTEKRITNILLMEAPISTRPKNLESTWKITPEKNLRSTIQTRVGILELDKKIGQPKKLEGYNQEKDRRNTTTMEMIMWDRKVNQMSEYQGSDQEQGYNSRKFNRKTQREAEFQVKQSQDEFLGRNSTNLLLCCIYFY
jgi:hypothetical protein